ncbi:MAG: hypothetical protein KatS3mg055_2768 [Chloroflexus sp.]|uniref:hypothetical protein n=1 Tax=Chloroflexus sp. TaxID=1904827 RepID=UPI0021DD5053|nr:hypothetical protein [Chloroflexus sp.]GIV90250.1 MAG: hypothetical protein KatS3mg055_2768 [Chloroflexus sp.]
MLDLHQRSVSNPLEVNGVYQGIIVHESEQRFLTSGLPSLQGTYIKSFSGEVVRS